LKISGGLDDHMKKFQEQLKDPEYQKKMKEDMKKMMGGLMGGGDGKGKRDMK
jgi:hypothetical protein